MSGAILNLVLAIVWMLMYVLTAEPFWIGLALLSAGFAGICMIVDET